MQPESPVRPVDEQDLVSRHQHVVATVAVVVEHDRIANSLDGPTQRALAQWKKAGRDVELALFEARARAFPEDDGAFFFLIGDVPKFQDVLQAVPVEVDYFD